MAFVAPNREAGRILYQGMMDQARGIAGAVNQFVDEGYKRQEQDKEFNAKLKVAEQTLKTFIKPKAAEFGTTPEAIDAMLQNTNLSPKERYLQIGGFVEQAITSAKMNRDAQQAETQRKYTDALAASALAQKSATDAATAERQRETRMAEQFIKNIKELKDFEQMEQSDAPFTIEQSERFQQLKGSPMLGKMREAADLGLDPANFAKILQGERALNIQQQDITSRNALADLRAENTRLQRLIEAGKQPKFNAGEEREFSISDNVTVTGVWDGSKYIEKKTGLPIVENVTYVDSSGNRITEEGGYNPAVLKRYGIPVPERGKVYNPFAKKTEGGGETEEAARAQIARDADAEANAAMGGGAGTGAEEEQPNPANLRRVSGTGAPSAPAQMGLPSRGPVSMDFLYRSSPRFNTAEEVQAAVNANPSLIGKIVLVAGKPVRVKGPQ